MSSKLILIISSYTVSKFTRFFETQCISTVSCQKAPSDIFFSIFTFLLITNQHPLMALIHLQ